MGRDLIFLGMFLIKAYGSHQRQSIRQAESHDYAYKDKVSIFIHNEVIIMVIWGEYYANWYLKLK